MNKPVHSSSRTPIDRRRFFKGLAVGGVLATTATRAPHVYATKQFEVRVLGTHVTLQEPLRIQAEKELGIKLIFYPGGDAAILHRASTRPDSFDLYEQWSNSIRVLWQAEAIQPIDINRIRYWHEINELSKLGRLRHDIDFGLGDAPNKILYVQNDGELGTKPTDQVSFLPYVHNVDSFGYNQAIVPKGIPYETESWAWLLDPRWHGKVAVVNDPTIGLFDLALAAQSAGWMKFADIGNMSHREIDQLFVRLVELKKSGHFRGAWRSVPESVEFMCNSEVVIQSMFSPGVAAVNGAGIDCSYAAPREGYRAWHGVMCLSSRTTGPTRDAAYEYMNWWLSGWPGAFMARQGYYISNPERSREYLTPAEWDYWYAGKPAAQGLTNIQGDVCVPQGSTRSGGSYVQRFSHIAVWNTVMNNYEYTLPRWRDFLLA